MINKIAVAVPRGNLDTKAGKPGKPGWTEAQLKARRVSEFEE